MVSESCDEHTSLLSNERQARPSFDDRFGEQHFLPKLFATSFNYLVSGIAVTSLGAVLGQLELYYDIPDSKVSIIFPCTLCGYLCSTASIYLVHVRSGRRGLGAISSTCRLIAHLLLSFGPPFHICLAAYCLLGFGTGLTDSGWSAWASGLRQPNLAQGTLHGSFGLGCILGPLVTVAIVNHGYLWYWVYRLLAIFVAFELVIQFWAFWHNDATEYRKHESEHEVDADAHEDENGEGAENVDVSQTAVPLNPFRYRGTWLCAAYFFVYVSIEFTFSDWIVIFMRRVRLVPYTTAGLASSIVWLGQSFGRFCLAAITERYGVKRCITIYLMMSIVFQVIFKLVESQAIALLLLGFIGFSLGPTFPSGLVLLSTSIPKEVQVNAVAIACAIGQIGAAAVPFMIGFMAERIGIERLLDVVLGLTATLIIVWLGFSRLC